jgi:hypothetical protein
MHIYLVVWYLLLIISHTAYIAGAVKTLLAQLEPLLELVEISEEIQCWWIRIVDLLIAIHQTLLTFNNSTNLVELL